MSVFKLKLDNEQLAEEFFASSCLLGIVASVKDYQLCWYINQAMHLHFRVNNELEIKWMKNKKAAYFTVFESREITKSAAHYLYNNHYKAEALLSELKHIDYLWLIKGDYYGTGEIKILLEQVKNVPSVQLVSALDLAEIKNRQNLIF